MRAARAVRIGVEELARGTVAALAHVVRPLGLDVPSAGALVPALLLGSRPEEASRHHRWG